MKYYIIVFFLSMGLFAQYPGTDWRKYYKNDRGARSICQISDGGFLIAGDVDLSGLYILKIDSYGDSLWARNYSDSG